MRFIINFLPSDSQPSHTNQPSEGWSIFSGAGTYISTSIYWSFLVLNTFGLFNNLFVLIILFKQQLTPHLTILKSLAYADLLENIALILLINYPVELGPPGGFLGDFLCCTVFSSYITLSLGSVSAWHIVLLAIELYGEAIRPKWYEKVFGTKTKTRLIILFCWILGFYIMSNSLSNFYEDNGACYMTWRYTWLRYGYGIQELLLILIVPIAIIVSCYARLMMQLLRAKRDFKARSEVDPFAETNYKALKTMSKSLRTRTICLLAIYIITWLPDQVIWLMYVLELTPKGEGIFEEPLSHVTQFSPLVNAALNPVVYGWTWFEFRDVALDKLAKTRQFLSSLLNPTRDTESTEE